MVKADERSEAGVLLEAEGLHPTSKGARLTFSRGKPTVTDGPFPETRDLLAGFWMIQAKSKKEAIEWGSRAPFGDGAQLEIRQVFEMSDFPAEILPPEGAAREHALREELTRKAAKA